MLSQKRRKKRQAHGLKTVEIYRGKQGYGFTISGHQPCILGNIVAGSPADSQGLKDGDHLVTVNGQAVSQLTHDQIVLAIGSSSRLLRLQIAEGSKVQQHHDSDSSDEHYVKPRYTHRTRSRSNLKTNHTSAHPQAGKKAAANSLQFPSHQGTSSRGATLSLALRKEDPFPTIYNPTTAINGRASDFGVFRSTQQHEMHSGGFYQQRFNPENTSSGQMVRSSSVPDVSTLDSQATGLSKILYPAMQPMSISSSSTINTEDDQPSLRVIVGYVGSIEMPQDSNLPSSRLQSIRSAVRRLRIEQKVHTLVLLEIRADGIRLSNPMGATIVHYPVSKLAMSGMYPDDKRFFGLVTIQGGDDPGEVESDLSSSCHVFMVDPVFSTHNVHAAKAKTFGVHCTIDPTTHRCIEFPKSCSPILRTAAKLYKDKHGGIFDVPRRQERQVSSDSDTNSDSGLGFHKGHDESIPSDRVYVVDVHIPNNSDLSSAQADNSNPAPTGAFAMQRSQTPNKSATLGIETPSARLKRLARDSALSLDARRPSCEGVQNGGAHNRAIDCSQSKLAISPAAVTRTSLDPLTVEQLRSNMQRLLALRKENVKDTQSLSDTESIMSDVRSRGSSGSRVSFNPQVAIATHHYIAAPASSHSSSSESSYSGRRDGITYQQPMTHSRKQRSKLEHSEHLLKGKPPPPIPPKPSLLTSHQHSSASTSRLREHNVAGWPGRFEETCKSRTLDGQFSQKQSAVRMPRSCATLDSKLSPRAYPSTAPRQARVTTGFRSAFQKVALETDNPPQINFSNKSLPGIVNRNKNHSNNNGVSGCQVARSELQQGGPHTDKATVSRLTVGKGRPIPAPRPSRELLPDRLHSPQGRSCSVPPDNRSFWQNCGRELNVDDGLSIRSDSVTSLLANWLVGQLGYFSMLDDLPQTAMVNRNRSSSCAERQQHKHHDRLRDVDGDKAISSESLVEVGSRGSDRSKPVSSKSPTNNNNVGRVASWAVSFENLLQDEEGVGAFSEFLKKEYSQENIRFWLACKNFKSLEDPSQQLQVASHIYNTYLSPLATDAVNIDSCAAKNAEEYLTSPSPSMFDEAQCQIFTLMKRDSYTRFIKSPFYQSYLVREFEHDKLIEKEKVKLSLSSDADSDTQKRRMLPGFFKDISRTLSSRPTDKSVSRMLTEGSSSTLRKTWTRGSEDNSMERTKNKKFDGTLTTDLMTIKDRLESDGSQDEGEAGKFLRVLLPDGSTTVMQVKSSDSLRSVLATLLNKKSSLPITSIEVFPLESDRAIDISQTMGEIVCREVRVEKRSVFRIVLPDKRNVGVKAKPHRTVRDVLRPILLKYGFNIDEVVVTQSGEVVSHEVLVSSVDERRLTIVKRDQFQDWGISARKNPTQDLTNGWEDLVDFEDALTQDLLGQDTSKKPKGSQFFGMLKNYSVDDGTKGSQRKTKGKNVTFGPTKSMDDQYLSKPETNEIFLDMLTKVQSSRIDDQRGLSIDVSEMPEFLKSSSDQHSETDDGSMSPPQTRVSKNGARSHSMPEQSVLFNDQSSTASSDPPAFDDGQDSRVPRYPPCSDGNPLYGCSSNSHLSHSHTLAESLPQNNTLQPLSNEAGFSTPPSKLNSSYYTAIQGHSHLPYVSRTPDMNATLQADNRTLDGTLTPKLPLSPLPVDLPPPPQFGNELVSSTPLGPKVPPSYKDSLHRSSQLAFSANSSNKTVPISQSQTNTLPGNNPGNRLSYAHHQPLIFHDEERSTHDPVDRSTPSPTTHTLLLEDSHTMSTNSEYNFYEQQYKTSQGSQQATVEPVKVTFV
ncbi:regulator of G-protein signaling 12-like isoform X3 [Watersipora subatra]|uniref:regulator of G-protein signaling 12-like isoform X3 n=1 Tax=Watersipora subatra TaxID=2589382 RepID=UPI00355B1868